MADMQGLYFPRYNNMGGGDPYAHVADQYASELHAVNDTQQQGYRQAAQTPTSIAQAFQQAYMQAKQKEADDAAYQDALSRQHAQDQFQQDKFKAENDRATQNMKWQHEDRGIAAQARAADDKRANLVAFLQATDNSDNADAAKYEALGKQFGVDVKGFGTSKQVQTQEGPVTEEYPLPTETQTTYPAGAKYLLDLANKKQHAEDKLQQDRQFELTNKRLDQQAQQAHLDRMAMLASKGNKNEVPPGTDTEAMANQLLAAKAPWPSSRQWMLPEWKEAYQIALAKDPTFNANTYQMRAAMQKEANSGQLAKTANSGTTLIKHLDALLDETKRVGDPTTIKAGNTVVNFLRKNSPGGSPELAAAAMDTNAVADEMERFYTMQGTEGGRKDWRAEFDINNPLPARLASIKAAAKLIQGKILAGQTQYNRGMGKFGDQQLIDPESQAAIDRIQGLPQKQTGTPSGGSGATPISSKAEYDALPSGAAYIAKDGTKGVKP